MVALDPDQEEPEAPLLDLEIRNATAWDCKGETKKKSGLAAVFAKFFEQTDAEKEEADRVARWALRVFLFALWLYLVNLMRQFVIASGTGEGRAYTAAAMVLVAFSMGGLFCIVGTPEEEHTDGEEPKPASRPRAWTSSREDGWTMNPNLLLGEDDDDDYDSN